MFAPKSGHSMASRALLPLSARDQSRPLKHEYATTAVSQSTRFSTLSAQQKSSFKNGHKDHCINHGGTKFSISLSFTIILYPCLRERFKGVKVIRLRKYYFTFTIKKYSSERRQALDSNYQCFYLKLEMVMLF